MPPVNQSTATSHSNSGSMPFQMDVKRCVLKFELPPPAKKRQADYYRPLDTEYVRRHSQQERRTKNLLKIISNQRRTQQDGQPSRTNEGQPKIPEPMRDSCTCDAQAAPLHKQNSSFERSTRGASNPHEENMIYLHIPKFTVSFLCMKTLSLLWF